MKSDGEEELPREKLTNAPRIKRITKNDSSRVIIVILIFDSRK